MKFKVVSEFKPTGDQPNAIKELVKGLNENEKTLPDDTLSADR